MARSYASVYLTIWNDPDFRDMSVTAQWLYFAMLTHPTLTSCGVMEWREARLVRMVEGLSIRDLRNAAWELGERRLIAVDPDTEEALVRSFVRHDGGLKSPNLTKAMVREHGAIASQMIMSLVSREVRRAIDEHPDYKGVALAAPVAKQFPEPFDLGSVNPSVLVPDWFHSGSDLVPPPEGEPFDLGSSPSPSPSPSSIEERGAASDEAATPPKKGTRIKADWHPSQSVIDTIRDEYPGLDLRAEHQNFIDYWLAKPGQAALKLDWDVTWRRWMRKAGKEQSEKRNSGYRNQNQIMEDIRRDAQARDAQSGFIPEPPQIEGGMW